MKWFSSNRKDFSSTRFLSILNLKQIVSICLCAFVVLPLHLLRLSTSIELALSPSFTSVENSPNLSSLESSDSAELQSELKSVFSKALLVLVRARLHKLQEKILFYFQFQVEALRQ